MIKEFPVFTSNTELLNVQVYKNRELMGQAAAQDIADALRRLLSAQQEVRVVFAAAPSQNEVLAGLTAAKDIDWSRVTAFHMDEYLGLPAEAPQGFGNFLKERLFDKVKPGKVHLINGQGSSEEEAAAECTRYSALFREKPIDIVCLGIGENGHIAFNDPPVADFADRQTVKVVKLDQVCRQQQVNDGCFASLQAVPTHALTVTIPALASGGKLFCVVPGKNKHSAVRRTLNGPISTECPATILRRHPSCVLYLDQDSYGGAE